MYGEDDGIQLLKWPHGSNMLITQHIIRMHYIDHLKAELEFSS